MLSFSFHNSLLYACSAAVFAQALSVPSRSILERSNQSSCQHGPSSRYCWSQGFDIDTNYQEHWPDTGKTVSYDLYISDQPCNPDGHGEKMCQLINGQYPGPAIRANWGDKVKITVHNDLADNGTSIHWHGVRQLGSNEMDGTNGVTECPIAPSTSKTYEFRATQYGTSWYHSHHTAQYGQGVVGPIIFDGPSTANYDEDLGVLPLTDWSKNYHILVVISEALQSRDSEFRTRYYDSIYALLVRAMHTHGPASPPNTVLVNGTMIDGSGNGQYQRLNVQAGKKYRLRFVNTAMDHLFHVSMDGHPFTVIQADFVPTKPYQTTDLKLNVGQRYDIVFEANQAIANYWLRVSAAKPGPQGPICGEALIYQHNVTSSVVGAVLSYDGAADALPTSSPYSNDGTCNDETFVPHFTTPRSGQYNLDALNITSGPPTEPVVHWYINGTTMDVDWENPTLTYIRDQKPFTSSMSAVEMCQANSWYLWVIENALNPPIPHPIHLHGHDFEILGSGVGPFPWGKDFITSATPMRRDVATMPGAPSGGWLLLGVYTDNPGAWLMHCHIGWHASQGFSMQFVERKSEIIDSIGSLDGMEQECAAWSNYWNGPTKGGVKADSGL